MGDLLAHLRSCSICLIIAVLLPAWLGGLNSSEPCRRWAAAKWRELLTGKLQEAMQQTIASQPKHEEV